MKGAWAAGSLRLECTSCLSLPPLLAISTLVPGCCLPSVGCTCMQGSGQLLHLLSSCVLRGLARSFMPC